MTSTRDRTTIIRAILILASVLVVGLMLVHTTSAEPKKAYGSISSRVTAQTDLCESLGGGELHVSYAYEDGKLVGASTSCKGGKYDGYNCTNTPTTTDCWQAPRTESTQPPLIVRDRPGIAEPISDVQVVQVTPDVTPVFDTVPSDGSVIANDPASTTTPITSDAPVFVEIVPLTPVSAP